MNLSCFSFSFPGYSVYFPGEEMTTSMIMRVPNKKEDKSRGRAPGGTSMSFLHVMKGAYSE